MERNMYFLNMFINNKSFSIKLIKFLLCFIHIITGISKIFTYDHKHDQMGS